MFRMYLFYRFSRSNREVRDPILKKDVPPSVALENNMLCKEMKSEVSPGQQVDAREMRVRAEMNEEFHQEKIDQGVFN